MARTQGSATEAAANGVGAATATAQPRDREESEFVEKLVSINRVAKVVKGGRRFGFAALVVVGDSKGRVGYGSGKAREVPEAIRKATEQARRGMIRVPLREGRTLHHDIIGSYGAGEVVVRAAKAGTGIIAGGPMRAIFEALGVQDVVAKSVGTSNPHNMIKATFEALEPFDQPARGRGAARQEGRRDPRPPRRPKGAGVGGWQAHRNRPRRPSRWSRSAARSARHDQGETLKGLGLNKLHRQRGSSRIRPRCAA